MGESIFNDFFESKIESPVLPNRRKEMKQTDLLSNSDCISNKMFLIRADVVLTVNPFNTQKLVFGIRLSEFFPNKKNLKSLINKQTNVN